jgi:hypothetical protein
VTVTTTIVGALSLTTATTAETQSTTITITETSIETDTATQTMVAPTPTSYAQCDSNNMIGSANGNQGIYQIQYSGPGGVAVNQVPTTDPLQCCVTCAQASGCVGYSQYPNGPCYFFTVDPSRCDGSNTFGRTNYADQYSTLSGIAAGSGYIVGNGQCGRFANGGASS